MTHDIGTFNLNSMGKVGAVISVFYIKTLRFRGFSHLLRFTHLVNGVVTLRPKAMCLYI